jgi:hypothetical protein
MLRINNDAVIVRLPWSLARMFTGRYAIQSGRKLFDGRWSRAQIDAICSQQHSGPVSMVRANGRVLWYFMGSFYWDDEGLREEEVRALVTQRHRCPDRKTPTAHSVMRAEETGGSGPMDISDDLRRAIDERSAGRPARVNVS